MHYNDYWRFQSPDNRQLNAAGMDIHPESVVGNKNGGRYDETLGRPTRFNALGMNAYRTDSNMRRKILYHPPVYNTLPAHPTQAPRLVKKTK